MRVYKILTRAEWEAARAAGRYEGSRVDLDDGFIHLSTAAQAPETARRHFAGQAGLVVVEFEAGDLAPALQWEPSRGGELFPHLYAPLDPAKALTVREAPLGDDGVPMLGPLT
ncbi:DUF952 domain-containing protein [Phenylobacterium sp.]|jgi:uncharacterized protein (DUF952 family)|uniref:DUF952 domain-containing protein n=1 Tax=Phenylobacterium sp. TaxID=1871053 RepID=UPI0039C996F5